MNTSHEINPIASHESGLHAGRSQRGCPICAKYDRERVARAEFAAENRTLRLVESSAPQAGCSICGGIGFGSNREACAECGR